MLLRSRDGPRALTHPNPNPPRASVNVHGHPTHPRSLPAVTLIAGLQAARPKIVKTAKTAKPAKEAKIANLQAIPINGTMPRLAVKHAQQRRVAATLLTTIKNVSAQLKGTTMIDPQKQAEALTPPAHGSEGR